MSIHRYIIRVNGNIIGKGGNLCAQGWAAGGFASLDCDDDFFGFSNKSKEMMQTEPFVYKEKEQLIESDLILDRNSRLVPYALYAADGGIVDYSNILEQSLNVGGIYDPAFASYRYNVDEIKGLLHIDICKEAEDAFLRGLYIQTFSVFELFLSDYLLCGIFNEEGCYDNAINYFKKTNKKLVIDSEIKMCEEINSKVFHNIRVAKKLYSEILHKDIQDFGVIKDYLITRNDLAHRYVFTKLNHMQPILVDRNMIQRLIDACDLYVSNI